MFLKRVFKKIIYICFNFLSEPFRVRRVSVLMYHSIDKNPFLFTVSPKNFNRQMSYLKRKKYSVLRIGDLVEKIKNGEKLPSESVVITFDDGYKDNYLNAFPVLKKYGFPATVFLSTSYIGKKFNNLNILDWQEIKEMTKSGLIDFAFHTHTHPGKMAEISEDDFYQELEVSKNIMEKNISQPSFIFAYPRGSYNENQVEFLKKNGFKGAVTVKEGLVKWGDDPFLLKRNFIHKNCSFSEFKGKLNLGIVWLALIKNFWETLFKKSE